MGAEVYVIALVSFPRQRPQNDLALVILGNFFVCYVSGSVYPSRQAMFCMFGGSDYMPDFLLFIFRTLFSLSLHYYFSFDFISLLFFFLFLFSFVLELVTTFLSRWCLILFTLYVNYFFFSFHFFSVLT